MRQELKNLKLAVNKEKEAPRKEGRKKGGKNVSDEGALLGHMQVVERSLRKCICAPRLPTNEHSLADTLGPPQDWAGN